MTNKWDVITVCAAVGCGTVGGVFFAFSALVMSGLTRLPDTQGIEAMKSINVTAVRPPLMLALFGSAALCVAVAAHAIATWGDRQALLLLIGASLYLTGAIVLTIVYNVPLNNHLATLSSHAPDAATQWRTYARDWTIANHVRAVASLAAMVLLILAPLASRSSPSSEGLPPPPPPPIHRESQHHAAEPSRHTPIGSCANPGGAPLTRHPVCN
jgi:uncharacterized membrane protein